MTDSQLNLVRGMEHYAMYYFIIITFTLVQTSYMWLCQTKLNFLALAKLQVSHHITSLLMMHWKTANWKNICCILSSVPQFSVCAYKNVKLHGTGKTMTNIIIFNCIQCAWWHTYSSCGLTTKLLSRMSCCELFTIHHYAERQGVMLPIQSKLNKYWGFTYTRA